MKNRQKTEGALCNFSTLDTLDEIILRLLAPALLVNRKVPLDPN